MFRWSEKPAALLAAGCALFAAGFVPGAFVGRRWPAEGQQQCREPGQLAGTSDGARRAHDARQLYARLGRERMDLLLVRQQLARPGSRPPYLLETHLAKAFDLGLFADDESFVTAVSGIDLAALDVNEAVTRVTSGAEPAARASAVLDEYDARLLEAQRYLKRRYLDAGSAAQ